MKAERRLTQELLGTVLGQSEPGIKWQLDEWDKTLSILDTHNHDLVGERYWMLYGHHLLLLLSRLHDQSTFIVSPL